MPDDWLCPICKFKIFGKKANCFKCGSLRPLTIIVNNLKNVEYNESANAIHKEIEDEHHKQHKHRMLTDEKYFKKFTTPCKHGKIGNCWKC